VPALSGGWWVVLVMGVTGGNPWLLAAATMSTALRASFSFLKATSRFALLFLPNLPVSGENLNLWAAAALRRRSLLEGVALRQWGWWLSFELDVLLLVAVTPLLLCFGVPRLLLFFQVMLAGGALTWAGGSVLLSGSLPLF
jgi:hypothetical protein